MTELLPNIIDFSLIVQPREDISSKVDRLSRYLSVVGSFVTRSPRRDLPLHPTSTPRTASPAGMCSTSTEYLPCSSFSPFSQFFPSPGAPDPVTWTCGQTLNWVQRTARECNLGDVDCRSFHGMDGKDLCSLVRDDFGRLTSPYSGDVLMTQLSVLKSQCRFAGRCNYKPIRL